jgi:hypothetical protein
VRRFNDASREWMEAKWTSEGPIGVGSIAHFVGKGGGYENLEYDMEVTEFVKTRK